MDWRLIEYHQGDPFYNMAFDEAVFDAFCGGWSVPTVRFYGWDRPCVSLGYLQPASGCVDPKNCKDNGVTLVRRPTGGRAVAHGTDFTFSVVLDVRTIDGGSGVAASYRKTGEAVVRALDILGIKADFCKSRSGPGAIRKTVNCFDLCLENEVAYCGIKVLGCAQLRRGNAVLQQNSLALKAPASETVPLLGTKGVFPYGDGEYPGESEISEALRRSLEEVFQVNLIPGELSHREKQSLSRLEKMYQLMLY